MRVRAGKYAGHIGRVHQFANDWMSAYLENVERPVILRPSQVQLEPDERGIVLNATGVGTFWQEWRLNPDGTFTAIRQSRRARA